MCVGSLRKPISLPFLSSEDFLLVTCVNTSDQLRSTQAFRRYLPSKLGDISVFGQQIASPTRYFLGEISGRQDLATSEVAEHLAD